MSIDAKDTTRLYFNVAIQNPLTATGLIDASIKQDLDVKFITNLADFDSSIVRASVPLSNVPFFLWKSNFYYVTLSWRGVDYKQAVQLIDWGTGTADGNGVFWITQMIDSINAAFSLAYTAVRSANPTDYNLFAGHAPYITFSPVTELFTLITDVNSWEITASVGNPAIYFNTPLMALFPNLPNSFVAFNSASGKDNQLRIVNRPASVNYPTPANLALGNITLAFAQNATITSISCTALPIGLPVGTQLAWGGLLFFGAIPSQSNALAPVVSVAAAPGATSITINSYVAPQGGGLGQSLFYVPPQQIYTMDETPSVLDWMQYSRILVKTSGKLPIRPEAQTLSAAGGVGSGFLSSQLILTDFIIQPQQRLSGGSLMLMIPQPQYRWMDVVKEGPQICMDLEFWAADLNGTLPEYKIRLEPGTGVTSKLLFDRKTTSSMHLPSDVRREVCGGSYVTEDEFAPHKRRRLDQLMQQAAAFSSR